MHHWFFPPCNQLLVGYHVVAPGFRCGIGSADLEARAGTYLRDPNMTPGLCRETVATTSPNSAYFAFVHSGEESPGCIVCREGWDPDTMNAFGETDLYAVQNEGRRLHLAPLCPSAHFSVSTNSAIFTVAPLFSTPSPSVIYARWPSFPNMAGAMKLTWLVLLSV